MNAAGLREVDAAASVSRLAHQPDPEPEPEPEPPARAWHGLDHTEALDDSEAAFLENKLAQKPKSKSPRSRSASTERERKFQAANGDSGARSGGGGGGDDGGGDGGEAASSSPPPRQQKERAVWHGLDTSLTPQGLASPRLDSALTDIMPPVPVPAPATEPAPEPEPASKKQLSRKQCREMVRIQLEIFSRLPNVTDEWIDTLFEEFDVDNSDTIDDAEWEKFAVSTQAITTTM